MGSRPHFNSKMSCNFEAIAKRTKGGGNFQLFPCFEAEPRYMNVAASDMLLTKTVGLYTQQRHLQLMYNRTDSLRSRGHCCMNNER
jgi:hypothetical protein